jgi:hypothetical protein
MSIEVGKVYDVQHQRKGSFRMRVMARDGEWVDGQIVSGKARAMLSYNEREAGEAITVRESFCTFTEVTP